MSTRDDGWSPRCGRPPRLVRPVRLDPSGVSGPTPGQSKGPHWRRSSHGFFVPAEVPDAVPEQRILEQSVRLPAGGAVTGWAACRMAGAAYFDGLGRDGVGRRPVPLATGGPSLRSDADIIVLRDRLDASETTILAGVPCTTSQRALFDEMRRCADDRAAVVAMDMMAAAELESISRMRAYCTAHPGVVGAPRVRRALDLADEGSRSPGESRMRLVWVLDARLPRPLSNQPVFDRNGSLLGVADLFDEEAGVVGEYDGAVHRAARRHHHDVIREERFRRAGLEYFKVVGLDLADLGRVVDRMLATRERARRLAPRRRVWTLTPPRGWYDSPEDTMTLDERLEYRAWLRGA